MVKVLLRDTTGLKRPRLKVKKMVEAALRGSGVVEGEISVLLTDDLGIRELNRRFRHKDKPTDVLSFPMDDEYLLGDIVISVERASVQASEFGVSEKEELARLVSHGVLHLLGHDHVKGGSQARKMKLKEEELMRALKEEGLY